MANIASTFGRAAALSQILGTLFYSKVLNVIPFFNFFPKLVGSLLFIMSGIFWTLEILTDEIDEDAQHSRWTHVKNRFKLATNPYFENGNHALIWNAMAGFTTMVAGLLILLALYAGDTSPAFFWATNAIVMLSCLCWYKGSIPKKHEYASREDKLNQLAAVIQLVAVSVCMITVIPVPAFVDYIVIGLAIASSIAWFASYQSSKHRQDKLILDEPPAMNDHHSEDLNNSSQKQKPQRLVACHQYARAVDEDSSDFILNIHLDPSHHNNDNQRAITEKGPNISATPSLSAQTNPV